MADRTGVTWDAPDTDHPARSASRASYAAVAAGDKDGWLALFAPGALVEDPVGPSFLDPGGRGHRGHEAIGRFWDAFIGSARAFHFHTTDSFANGDACANATTITVTLGDGSTMTVAGLMVYIVDDAGLMTSMRAHWEPDRAMATLLAPGPGTAV
jgi:ketosteroid isomerase-like protein